MKNTNNQGFTGFDDLSGVVPAVESLLDQGQRRNIESHLPKNLRSQRKKEREQARVIAIKILYASILDTSD